ncbi:hypothetical protein ACFW04_007251 [Cataglyphis niger]
MLSFYYAKIKTVASLPFPRFIRVDF